MMLAAAALALPLNAAQPAKKTAKVKKQNKKEVKASKKWDHEQVVELITKVNNYWQANNKPGPYCSYPPSTHQSPCRWSPSRCHPHSPPAWLPRSVDVWHRC